jgi:myo-inositol-1(or 4)-monophosphatase
MNVDDIAKIARAAGEVIQEVRSSAQLDVGDKGADGPVTLADRRADALLRGELIAIAPAAWLSEESVDDISRLKSRRIWIVDPLDGTKEFIAGLPEYAISIALVDDGQPIAAVVHNPATHETFSAERGSGAWSAGHRLQSRDDRSVLASRSEIANGEFASFEAAGFELRPIGSIALKLALVAAGRASVTLSRGPKWEWDVCAGALLVEEGGGTATDVDGARFSFNQPFPKTRGVLAGARESYARALAFVRSVGPSERMTELDQYSASSSRARRA